MFGIDTSEILIVVIAALIFIGPKELPGAMRAIGRFFGKIRHYSRHFTAGIETAMREAELEEMEKEWRAQNDKIMQEFPSIDETPTMTPRPARDAGDAELPEKPEQPGLPLDDGKPAS
ncbi:MAG: twin-arginine translocase subunit TatB [Sphingomonas sp.]|nr:twin-arginine translocase subunit TatB [Sphingomonas sp.]